MAAVLPVPANKGKRLPGEVLTAEEVRALVRACGRSPSGVRNAALVAVMFGAALRVSEARALRPSDLDLEGRHGSHSPWQGRQGAHRRSRPWRPGVPRTLAGQACHPRPQRSPARLLHRSSAASNASSSERPSTPPMCAGCCPGWRDGRGSSAVFTRTHCATASLPPSLTRASRCRRSAPSSATAARQ